jgi:hypothetical protein
MNFLKLSIAVVMMANISTTNYNKVRLQGNYVCDLSTPPAFLDMNYFAGLNWSVGFWIKVPMQTDANAELLALKSTLSATPFLLTVESFDEVEYKLCSSGSSCLHFSGGSPLTDSNYSYLKKSQTTTGITLPFRSKTKFRL